MPWAFPRTLHTHKKENHKEVTMSFRPINLDAFWKQSFPERYQLLNTLIFLHEKKCDIERVEKATKSPAPIITTLPPAATNAPVLDTPKRISNANPPFAPPRLLKKVPRMTAPDRVQNEESDEDFEVIIHKVKFDSDDESDDEGFIIHKKKKHTSFIPSTEKK
jgi:hypothetical protein